MAVEDKQIIVLGCGVSGLTCGIRLMEAGYNVTIWARDLPPNTTSNVAPAIWHPFKVHPVERAFEWGQRSFQVFSEIAEKPESGVAFKEAIEYFRKPTPDPWWRACVRSFGRALPEELPAQYADAYVYETAVIDTSVYLDYLISRFRGAGGQIVRREVNSLDEPLGEASIVINCTGLGSYKLVGDTKLFPIRGQIVRVEPPTIDHIIVDEDEVHGVAYIVPRANDCILGGTAEAGNWSLEPDPAAAEGILERCARLTPEIRNARVIEHGVGLRPGRNEVRLEAESQPDGKLVVHNYGHGGGGITLSWGCAEEVVILVGATG